MTCKEIAASIIIQVLCMQDSGRVGQGVAWREYGAGQGRAGQGRAGQGRAGQGGAGQGGAGQGRAGRLAASCKHRVSDIARRQDALNLHDIGEMPCTMSKLCHEYENRLDLNIGPPGLWGMPEKLKLQFPDAASAH